jgi:hypothetical protein
LSIVTLQEVVVVNTRRFISPDPDYFICTLCSSVKSGKMLATVAAQLGLETTGYFIAMFAIIFIVAYAFWGQVVGFTGLSR